MNCPGCGGALQPVGNRNHLQCEYCGRFHFPEEADDGIAPTGAPGTHHCPVCAEQPLAGGLLEGHGVEKCDQCRGLLCDLAIFSRAVAQRRSQLKSGSVEPRALDPLEFRRTIKCPQCQARMENYAYAGGGNAVVDACHRCQLIWLDAGELAAIANYLPVRPPAPSYVPTTAASEDDWFAALMS